MAPLLALFAASAAAAWADSVGVVSSEGWWSAYVGGNASSYVLEGSTFRCSFGTLLEAPDNSSDGVTAWQAEAVPNSEKVAYTSLCSRVGSEHFEDGGALLLSGLYDEKLQAGVIRICRPAAWDKVYASRLDVSTPCEVRWDEELDDSDCPPGCFYPSGLYEMCRFNFTNASCMTDARCVPEQAKYYPMDGEGHGQLKTSVMGGCLAARGANVTIEECDVAAHSQQWSVKPLDTQSEPTV